jgi:hypothetical protein
MVEPSPPSWGIGTHGHLADIFITICTCVDPYLEENVEPSPPYWGIGMHSHLADIFITICTCFDPTLWGDGGALSPLLGHRHAQPSSGYFHHYLHLF